MENVYLLLGSNLGDRNYYLKEAYKSIEHEIGKVTEASSVYETASWGKSDQPDYINQVLVVSTPLKPKELLHTILQVEKQLGRERTERWGSRTIDIDILFYGNEVVKSSELTIPHPELHNRRFTLEPLQELAPDLKHPILGSTIKELYSSLKDNLFVNKIKSLS